MADEEREREDHAGPGGGERSEQEPGPASRRRPGPRPGHARTHPWYTPEERRAAVEAYARSGMTLEGFARTWGVSSSSLYIWVKAYRERGPGGLEHPVGTSPRGRKTLPAPLRAEIAEVQRRSPTSGSAACATSWRGSAASA